MRLWVLVVMMGAAVVSGQQEILRLHDLENCFVGCVGVCVKAHPEPDCSSLEPHFSLVAWDCYDRCQYNCALNCTRQHVSMGGQPFKILGKWPQKRLLGLQEPMSALFSLANGGVHLYYLPQLLHRRLSPSPYTRPYIYSTIWSCVTWLMSTLFHACETPLTEKLDYMGANAHLFLFCYCSTIRCLKITTRSTFLVISCVFLAVAGVHWGYMLLVDFDYSLNMTVMVGLMAVQSVISWQFVARNRASYNWKFYLSNVGFWSIAIVFEVWFDFAPLWEVFDAHAIWHGLSPIPLVLFYQFLIADLGHNAAAQRSLPLHLEMADAKTL